MDVKGILSGKGIMKRQQMVLGVCKRKEVMSINAQTLEEHPCKDLQWSLLMTPSANINLSLTTCHAN